MRKQIVLDMDSPHTRRRHSSQHGKEPEPALMAASRRGWLRWALGAVIFISCALFVDFGDVVRILSRVPVHWIVFALALMTIDRCLMAWKWLILLRALDVRTSFKTVLRLYYQGTVSGIFLPNSFGGDLLRAYWVSESAGTTHRVYASLAMEKVIGLLSTINWAFIGGSVFLLMRWHEVSITWIAMGLSAALLVNSVFVFSLRPYSRAFVMRRLEYASRSRVIGFFHRLYEAYAEYGDCRRVLIWNGLMTFAEQGLQMFIFLILSWGLGIHVSVVLFLAVCAIHLLFYRLPISPNGWGVGEVTAIGLYGLIGVSSASAFALVFLAHVLHVIAVLPGLWFLWQPEPTSVKHQEFCSAKESAK